MIILNAPINQLGYGIASLNILKELSKITDICLMPIGQPDVTNQNDADLCKRALDNRKHSLVDKPCVKLWHQHDMARLPDHKGKMIGFPIFELDTFTDQEMEQLSSVDSLFVCSQWAEGVIKDNDIDVPTTVVPLGVDSSVFKPKDNETEDKTIFFNCGKWEVRKGHDALIKAWDRLSQNNDNIELWMMCDNPFNTPQEVLYWESLYNRPNIKIIPRVETQEEVYNIMSRTDCGVFPSRAEGWNLELLEMMACGKRVITTDYSAHTEFCNSDNSYLVEIDGLEPAFDGKWFFGHGNWAEITGKQEVQLLEYMQQVVNDKQTGWLHQSDNVQGLETAKRFSWENTAKRILEHVE